MEKICLNVYKQYKSVKGHNFLFGLSNIYGQNFENTLQLKWKLILAHLVQFFSNVDSSEIVLTLRRVTLSALYLRQYILSVEGTQGSGSQLCTQWAYFIDVRAFLLFSPFWIPISKYCDPLKVLSGLGTILPTLKV